MKRRDVLEIIALAALWGGSFPFMRIAVPEFGAIPLIEMRVTIAAVILIPTALLFAHSSSLQHKVVPIAVTGILNSAIPFALFAYATLSITSGLTSILNATTPLFGAIIAAAWSKESLSWTKVFGLLIGFGGVVFLFGGNATFKSGGSGVAILAALCATFSYGIAASYAKRYVAGVSPLTVAAGSQLASALLLLPLAISFWPKTNPSVSAWEATAGLGFGCTAIAYVLYFRLIAHVGAAKAVTVTFIIPVFAIFFGSLFLHEKISGKMLIACAVILIGTALTTGLIAPVKSIVNKEASPKKMKSI